jgi:predicted permease
MPFPSLVESLAPTLVAIGAGYALARWAGLTTLPLIKLLRFVFLPVFLFVTVPARMSPEGVFSVALVGAAVVGVGVLIHRNAHRVFKAQVHGSVAMPNVACFSIPLFALSWGGRGLGTACALFVGASVAAFIFQKGNPVKLLLQPWLYAVVAGLLLDGSVEELTPILTPLMGATYPLLLMLLGAALHPLDGLSDLGAWVTAVLRVVSGFGVAWLGASLLALSPAVTAGAIVAAMAPPATKALSLAGSGTVEPADSGPSSVGLLVSVLAFSLFMLTGWEPWL